MFWKKWTCVYVDQSESTIGVNRVKNLNTGTIAGKVVNHTSDGETAEGDVSVERGDADSIGIAFSSNVWVNGKRIC